MGGILQFCRRLQPPFQGRQKALYPRYPFRPYRGAVRLRQAPARHRLRIYPGRGMQHKGTRRRYVQQALRRQRTLLSRGGKFHLRGDGKGKRALADFHLQRASRGQLKGGRKELPRLYRAQREGLRTRAPLGAYPRPELWKHVEISQADEGDGPRGDRGGIRARQLGALQYDGNAGGISKHRGAR